MASIVDLVRGEVARLKGELSAAERALAAISPNLAPVTAPATPRAKAAAKVTAAPKRVRSEATKAKHLATLEAKRQAKLAAANGATEPAPALDAE